MAQHTDARHTEERHADERRSRERGLIMHRTAPEAAPMVVGHAPAPASRRSTAVGIAMLVIGVAAVIGALIALGARIFPAFRAVRDTALDPAAVFFMGTSGSVGELVLVIALMALVPIGIVVGWLGYRRLTDDGPSLAAMHLSNSPNAVINDLSSGGGGM